MECKICGREKIARKDFRDVRRRICIDCMDDMGYGNQIYTEVHSDLVRKFDNEIEGRIRKTITTELPAVLERMIVAGMDIELVVVPK